LTKKSRKKSKKQSAAAINDPWLSKRSALLFLIVISLALGIYIVWQLYPVLGLEAFLWGLGLAGSIWVVFGFYYVFNTWVRGRKQGQ
jgi:hypothetical protein